MTRVHLMAWLAAVLCQIGAASGAIVRVPEDQPTILAGIDASSPGDTVLVGPGTYTTSATRTVDFGGGTILDVRSCAFLKNGTVLLGASGPDVTTIDLAGVQGGSFSAVIVGGLLSSNETRVGGFTITGTAALGDCGGAFQSCGRVIFVDCIFQKLAGYGILCDTSALAVESCEFRNCADTGIRIAYAALTVQGCHFEGCLGRGIRALGWEGNVHEATILDCTFLDNSSPGSGGGLSVSMCRPVAVENCWFEGNTALQGGGAILVGGSGMGGRMVRGNVFVGNSATMSSSGGAVKCGSGWTEVIGNTFYGNSQEYQFYAGSAVSIFGSANVENNVFVMNTGNAAVAVVEDGHIDTACNVFWDNPDGDIEGFEPDSTDMFCDPQFCDPEANDFTVSSTSPCLPQNNAGCGLIGALGQGCGGVAVERDSWAVIKSKYRRQ